MTEPVNLEFERAVRAENCMLLGAVTLLKECIRQIESGEIPATSALVILVDRGEDGEAFDCHWRTAKLVRRESLGAMEQVKFSMLSEF